ncbi:hypothetical protein JVT61DRAFT_2897 [Boletus reticuloceps]|uniref:Uncharacterized protein n=1 Tax=Boletus reticuloceps TaxID=495285 RepID=A0A8I2YSH4_9AGAM|nr:hypothetical protein JVT61DRAFT_2897 [Boletus reticuloceps]
MPIFKPTHRRTIYDEVISKICKYLAHPSVIDPIKQCIQPFKLEICSCPLSPMT